MQPRFLRQKTTGHIYMFTEPLALRKDMEPYDPETAQKRIETLLARKAELSQVKSAGISMDPEVVSAMTEDSKLLTQLENEIAKAEESKKSEMIEGNPDTTDPKTIVGIIEKERADRVNEDPEVRKIRLMVSEAEVQEYTLIHFGKELPVGLKLKALKKLAVEEREKIIFAEK